MVNRQELARVALVSTASAIAGQVAGPAAVPPTATLAWLLCSRSMEGGLLPRTLQERSLMRQKLRQDLANGPLEGPAMARWLVQLGRAGLLAVNDPRVLPSAGEPRTAPLASKDVIGLARSLPDSLRVDCGALQLGAIAALRELEQLLGPLGVELHLEHTIANSRDQARTLVSRGCPEFAVIADLSRLMVHARLPYALVLALTQVRQTIFRRKARGTARFSRLFVYAESSAELHPRLGIGVDPRTELKLVECSTDLAASANDLAGGDELVAWEPLASALRSRGIFEELPGAEQAYTVSLHARRDLPGEQIEAFGRLLVHSWRSLQRDPRRAWARVAQIPGLSNGFARGGGLKELT